MMLYKVRWISPLQARLARPRRQRARRAGPERQRFEPHRAHRRIYLIAGDLELADYEPVGHWLPLVADVVTAHVPARIRPEAVDYWEDESEEKYHGDRLRLDGFVTEGRLAELCDDLGLAAEDHDTGGIYAPGDPNVKSWGYRYDDGTPATFQPAVAFMSYDSGCSGHLYVCPILRRPDGARWHDYARLKAHLIALFGEPALSAAWAEAD